MWQKPTQNGFGQKRNFDVKKDWNWNWHQSTWILGAQDAIRARSPEGTQLEFLLSWHRCQTGKRGANVSSSTVFFSWKSLRELTQLNTRNTNGPVKECSEELNGHLSKEDVHMANTHMKNAQHHSLLEKCKSKPQQGTISCRSEWPPSKSLQTITAGAGVEQREPSHTVGGNANWYSHFREQCGDSLKNWK